MLEKINISKAAGPDLIPGRLLNMLAPIVHAIFTQSLDTGELPRDWSLANVAPIFKKGNRVLAENCRPVFLTCITCKFFEHIVCRHILDHVEDHKIFKKKPPPLQFFALTHLILELHYCALVTFPKK